VRTVLRSVNLLDGVRPLQSNRTLLVEGDRIAAVGEAASIETRPGDAVLSLPGKTVMPGMVSGHFHATFEGATLAIFPLGVDQPPGVLMLRAAKNARLALDCGFTSVVGAGGGDDIDSQLALAIAQGIVPGPRIVPCSRNLGTTSGYIDLAPWWYGMQNTGACKLGDGPDAFRAIVREEIRRGARMIKVFVTGGHGNVKTGQREFSRAELAAIVESAHEHGARVRAHAAWKTHILECVALGFDVIDHGDEVDAECIDAMARAGTFWDPSALYLQKLLELPELQGPETAALREVTARELENIARWLAPAHRAGVRIVLGDDYGTAFMPHGSYAEEIAYYVKRLGVAPLDALAWAMRNGGALTGIPDLGTLEPGKLADLLVVDGDPSADPTLLCDREKIRGVMRDGAWHRAPIAPLEECASCAKAG
jgi:imidazolonepropionase-like amidohydrolase